MYEIDRVDGYVHDYPPPPSRLLELGIVLGAEGAADDAPRALTGDSAHDPNVDIDTTPIGNGDVVADGADAEAFTVTEPTEITDDTVTVDHAAVATGHVAPLIVAAMVEPADDRDVPRVYGPSPSEEPEPPEAATVEITAATDAVEVDATTDEFGDTSLSRAEVLDQFERWERGEVVPSEAMPVARIELSDIERDTLAEIAASGEPFRVIGQGNLTQRAGDPHTHKVTGLTEQQLRVIAGIQDKFVAAVRQDGERNDYGGRGVTGRLASVGMFQPEHDTLDWHTDNFTLPAARYVLSFGDAGPTHFAEGPLQRDQIAWEGSQSGFVHEGVVDTAPNGTHRETNYGTGVVTRFLANHGVHRTPTDPGFRTFFTASIYIDRSRRWRDE